MKPRWTARFSVHCGSHALACTSPKRFFVFAIAVLCATSLLAVTPMSKPEPVKIQFIPASGAKAGDIVEAKLDLEIGKEWHLFSDKPEIPGIVATQLLLDPSDAYTVD